MLVINTTIRPSLVAGAGLGLFAGHAIKKGTVVWRFNRFFDIVYPSSVMSGMNEEELAFFKTYAYLSKYSGQYILSADNSHFCNHSSDLNNLIVRAGKVEHIEVASRDIAVGEELLIDYRHFDVNEQ